MTITQKSKRFNKVLLSAKEALDSIKMDFHLHAGTALGAHREKAFIEHDHDIDLAVFYKDANTQSKINNIKKAMEEHGFEIRNKLGKIDRGYEIQFEKNGISLDIFWIYIGEYRGKIYYILSSYFGECEKLMYKTCVWGYRPYKVQTINFLGTKYKVVPEKTLVDMYGADWHILKKFNYEEGITEGGYKGFLKDYYNPRSTDNKIAFCFLLYDTVKHNSQWVNFFSSDNYPVKSYNIYTHLKYVSDKTPEWVFENKITSIKTEWCEENLVYAWIKLIKKALEDPNNEYFIILSGECIPLYTYEETYKKITASDKSRINIDFSAEATIDTGLVYADQWVILNRKHATMLTHLKTTKEGYDFIKQVRKIICIDDTCYCPDELFPVNWFIHKYGKPSSSSFKKEFRIMPTTYTYWNGKAPHPVRLSSRRSQKMKKEICKSGALFARKFTTKAARSLAMSCGEK